ncbi:uncharacterized protein LAESUDRAFT_729776 [Laetiporus sulphureus 93-53]|uniref:Peptidase M14 domain-containing protein n=1 Tax=Laetiporus sulphureus 93-53 TaxID=1314785 RepID=A0A165CHC6_9APHY|nr:uncharacterized protein LAESUDRAFT_729776 [Laetiporus sulphureus 93-53]KZT02813.1 hypothetical protein LAESUDRAFT_729776 [Laetiporus sulphureus 93-53]
MNSTSLWVFWFLHSVLAYALNIPPQDAQSVLEGTAVASHALLKSFVVGDQPRDIDGLLNIAEEADVDVWRITPSHVDVYFPSVTHYLSSPFNGADIPHKTTEFPLSALSPPTEQPHPKSWNLTSLSNTTFHSVYHPLDEIEDFVQAMVALYPDYVQLVNIGHSAEGREMFAMKISKGQKANFKSKSGFVVTGAQHAREWIATSTALYLAHSLVSSASEPYAIASLLDNYHFYIIPVPNPDGYVYTWVTDRLWYKNRQILGPNEKCVGLDMNRNWGHKWKARADFPTAQKKPTTPTDPCTPWYPGHRAFESPEVNNIANYITTLPSLKAYIDLRSYGQMISTPFAYSCKKIPKDAEDQIEAALGAARAIKQVHGTSFTIGSLCSSLYKAPGNVVDWMYAKAGIKFSYAVHLRDTGTYGFALPPEWIRPVGEETAKMIEFLARFTTPGKFK